MTTLATVDSRIRLSGSLFSGFVADVKKAFSHANPEYYRRQKMGFSTYGVEPVIRTWTVSSSGELSVPRGGAKRLREIAARHDVAIRFLDDRLVLPEVQWPQLRFPPRDYQSAAREAGLKIEQGVIEAPTGAGKTTLAFDLLAATNQPALVIMRDSNLLEQWKERACGKEFNMKPSEIGILKGSASHRIGRCLTLALQQTLYSKSFPLEHVTKMFGTILVDEVQDAAAKTMQLVVDRFPARYRIGVSADSTRKDQLECLIYDQFGDIIYKITREELENRGVIHPVDIVLVPTRFSASWFRDAGEDGGDYNALLDAMIADKERGALLVDTVKDVLSRGEEPIFVFSRRVAHARSIADADLYRAGIHCGLMLGGDEERERFAADKDHLIKGELRVAAGTFAAIGRGIDIPNVRAGIIATPLGNNRQFFGQVRGRLCRASTATGKESATMYVLWDRSLFPDLPKKLALWNNGRVTIQQR